MIRLRTALAIALAGSMATAGHAQGQAKPATAPAGTQTPQKAAMNELVCQRIREIGSRLAVKKVCKTRAEWADIQLQDRQNLEQIQTQRGALAE